MKSLFLSFFLAGFAIIWNKTEQNIIPKPISFIEEYGQTAIFSPNGQFFFTDGHHPKLWSINDTGGIKELQNFTEFDNYTWSAVFSPDGNNIITGSEQNIKIWSTNSENLNFYYRVYEEGYVKSIDYTVIEDKKYILTTVHKGSISDDNHSAKLWLIDGQNSLKLIRSFKHDDWVNSAIFSPNGEYILTGSYDNTAKLWTLEGNVIDTFFHIQAVSSIAFSYDSKEILTGSYDQTAKLWAINGKLKRIFNGSKGHKAKITTVAFSPDGQHILTGSQDKTAKLWSSKGNLMQTYTGHDTTVASVVISPNRQYILTGSLYNNAYLWKTGLPLINTNPLFKTVTQTPSKKIDCKIEWATPNEFEHIDKEYVTSDSKLFVKLNIIYPSELTLKNLTFSNAKAGERLTPLVLDFKGKTKDGKYKYTFTYTTNFKELGSYPLQLKINKNNNSFTSKTLMVQYVPNKTKLFLISIGANPKYDLSYTANDANDFANLFQNHPLYKETIVKKLIDKNATATAIKLALSDIKKEFEQGNITKQDVVILFFASHGIKTKENYFIAANDLDKKDCDATAISLQHINDRLASVKCKKLLFIDACKSGNANANLLVNARSNQYPNGIPKNLLKKMDGWVVMTSSGKENSWEHPAWENGAFTEALLEGLKEGKADKNKNGYISVNELYQYVKNRVPKLNLSLGLEPQNPQIKQNTTGDDLSSVEIYSVPLPSPIYLPNYTKE